MLKNDTYTDKYNDTFVDCQMIDYEKCDNFYEQLDMVFDKLVEKYGFEDSILHYKQSLLKIYENENSYKTEHISKSVKGKFYIIDKDGCIKSIK